MKKVLVSTDLSAKSKAGIRFAIQLQKQTGCSLVFYHAIEIMKPTSWSDKKYDAFAKGKNAEFVAKLIEFADQVYDDMGEKHGKNSYHTEIGTKVPSMMVEYAKKIRADLICTATRGAGKFEKMLGSVATSLLTDSPIPVVIVPPRYKAAKIDEVQYATDLEGFATELKKVRSFTDAVKARLTVVHYNHRLAEKPVRDELQAKFSKYVSADVRLVFRKHNKLEQLADSIRRDLRKDRPAVLVLFTKLTKGWFRRLFTVSRTEQLALHPALPLLVFRKK